MANVWTPFIPTLYASFYQYLRQQTGLVTGVRVDGSMAGGAVGQVVDFPIVPTQAARDLTVGMTATEGSYITMGYDNLTLTKQKEVAIPWTGEDERSLRASIGHQSVLSQQLVHAMNTLTALIEADLAAEYDKATRAFGTISGSAFINPTDMIDDTADLLKIYEDIGAPITNLQAVVNTSVTNVMRKQDGLVDVSKAGTDDTLRRGILREINGISFRGSNYLKRPAIGTAANCTTDSTGYAVGSKTITLASAGTGTILAGDVIKIAGDDNFYVVKTGDADISGGGTIVLQEPGIQVAIPASTTAITVQYIASRNMVFDRGAIMLMTRVPSLPREGDEGQHTLLSDPETGLTFDLGLYKKHRMIQAELSIVWGVKVLNPHHLVNYLTK
jgi:hypothetical protein